MTSWFPYPQNDADGSHGNNNNNNKHGGCMFINIKDKVLIQETLYDLNVFSFYHYSNFYQIIFYKQNSFRAISVANLKLVHFWLLITLNFSKNVSNSLIAR